jgi:hypothetical protein
MGWYYGRNGQYLEIKGHRFFFTWVPGPQASDQQHGFKELEVTSICHGVDTRPFFAPPAALVRQLGWYYGRNEPNWE